MNASFIVAIAAILISAAGVLYARSSASSARESAKVARRSADAAERSVFTAERSLAIERHRRHEERRPNLSGKVDSPDGGHSYQLSITLDADSCPLTALEVSIRPEQGVFLKRGFSGVAPVAGSAEIPLRAFAYDRANKPADLQPGATVSWRVELAKEYGELIQVDATCHAEGKEEGEDQWTVVVAAPIEPRLLDTFG